MAAMMKWALVCGDGLPVSGLLTVFRSVVDRARAAGLLKLPVVADLGYSWRPDKSEFFPRGRREFRYPDWLDVTDAVPVAHDREVLMTELATIRDAVAAAGTLDAMSRRNLRDRIEALAVPYGDHFGRWIENHDVDWVIAVNMTLSDAVPVTEGLHRAAGKRFQDRRAGGILYWDHDLFASYAVRERGARVYPTAPNEFTPVPGRNTADRWAVVSPSLAEEALAYPTALPAELVPNLLPELPGGSLIARHHEFLAQHGLTREQPMVLVPVRLFRVKGVEISVEVFAGMRTECARRGLADPALLVFGSLHEEPAYAAEVRQVVAELGVTDAVTFLDGVPLCSHRAADGNWRLDEVDLLRIAKATGGAVLFTPNRTDVESVGLGPALAAVAGAPCAVTAYRAFDSTYGADFARICVQPGQEARAGADLVGWMAAVRTGRRWALDALADNDQRVRKSFPEKPWTNLLHEMAAAASRDRYAEAIALT